MISRLLNEQKTVDANKDRTKDHKQTNCINDANSLSAFQRNFRRSDKSNDSLPRNLLLKIYGD